MEPIARVSRHAATNLVAPWHRKWDRPKVEGGVHFHLFRYAPIPSLNTFGYAEGLRADVRLRASAIRCAAGPARRVVPRRFGSPRKHATIVHAHWVNPGGVSGRGRRSIPLVVPHGSDVFVAERPRRAVRGAAKFRRARWVTACSAICRREKRSRYGPIRNRIIRHPLWR